jgi:hypothetical protein
MYYFYGRGNPVNTVTDYRLQDWGHVPHMEWGSVCVATHKNFFLFHEMILATSTQNYLGYEEAAVWKMSHIV